MGFVWWALAGCRDVEEACLRYVDARSACIARAYEGDPEGKKAREAELEGICDPYAGTRGRASSRLLDCYADTIDAGDCSTPEAYFSTIGGVDACGGA
jgi:hypothetical protein